MFKLWIFDLKYVGNVCLKYNKLIISFQENNFIFYGFYWGLIIFFLIWLPQNFYS